MRQVWKNKNNKNKKFLIIAAKHLFFSVVVVGLVVIIVKYLNKKNILKYWKSLASLIIKIDQTYCLLCKNFA